ncbi:hypothetical protein HD806DRAFT_495133 [Xylariaceae sp. AK1471]|nr:hypothetical protein HD806DRAFT_495133 [Xylariaceae sp. AK1471]
MRAERSWLRTRSKWTSSTRSSASTLLVTWEVFIRRVSAIMRCSSSLLRIVLDWDPLLVLSVLSDPGVDQLAGSTFILAAFPLQLQRYLGFRSWLSGSKRRFNLEWLIVEYSHLK